LSMGLSSISENQLGPERRNQLYGLWNQCEQFTLQPSFFV
jgi:hypothetical protein